MGTNANNCLSEYNYLFLSNLLILSIIITVVGQAMGLISGKQTNDVVKMELTRSRVRYSAQTESP